MLDKLADSRKDDFPKDVLVPGPNTQLSFELLYILPRDEFRIIGNRREVGFEIVIGISRKIAEEYYGEAVCELDGRG